MDAEIRSIRDEILKIEKHTDSVKMLYRIGRMDFRSAKAHIMKNETRISQLINKIPQGEREIVEVMREFRNIDSFYYA